MMYQHKIWSYPSTSRVYFYKKASCPIGKAIDHGVQYENQVHVMMCSKRERSWLGINFFTSSCISYMLGWNYMETYKEGLLNHKKNKEFKGAICFL